MVANGNEFTEKLRHSVLEVYRHGSQNGNAFEFGDPRKDIVREDEPECEKTQEHEQPDGGGHDD